MATAVPRWKAYLFACLTLVAPGLGHLALGRRGRAATFFVLVVAMFALGISLDGALFPFSGSNLLFRLAALGEAGTGLLYAVGKLAGAGALDAARASKLMFGYGNTCLVAAGLMNMLLMMDVYDIAVGRKE